MKKVPANRLAAGGASAAAVAAAIVTVIGAVDTGPKAAVVSVGLAVIGVVVVVFLLGAQKDEARRAPSAPTSADSKNPYSLRGLYEKELVASGAIKAGDSVMVDADGGLQSMAKPDPDFDPDKGNGENVAVELGVSDAPTADPAAIPADRGDHEAADKDRA